MSQAQIDPRTIRGAIVAVTFVSLLTAFAIPAIAHEPSVCQCNVSASGPVPAGAADLLTHNAAEATGPACDLATLPPLDSIGAHTDITVFLKRDVPEELQVAALRRAWTTDPTIRDFRGLQDSDWDFDDPSSIFGFGDLGPEVDVTTIVAQIFGEPTRLAALALARPNERTNSSFLANMARRFILGAVEN